MRVRLPQPTLTRLPSSLSIAVRVGADGDLADLGRQLVDEHLSTADVLRLEELVRRGDRFVGPLCDVLE